MPRRLALPNIATALLAGTLALPALSAEPVRVGLPAVAAASGKTPVTIPVHEVIGLAGLVLPGDRVDVFVTQKRLGLGTAAPIAMTDRILHNVRVVAVAADDNDAEPRQVTLELTTAGHEMIMIAANVGPLSLMLRSAGGSVASVSSSETAPADLTWTAGSTPAAPAALPAQGAVLR